MKLGRISKDEAMKLNAGFAHAVIDGDYSCRRDFEFSFAAECALQPKTIILATDYENGRDLLVVARVTSNKMDISGDRKIRVSDGTQSWRTSCLAPIIDQTLEHQSKQEFAALCKLWRDYGVPAAWHGAKFSLRESIWTVVGLDGNATTDDWIVLKNDHTGFLRMASVEALHKGKKL